MTKLIAKIRNNEFVAKEDATGKFFAWVPRANYGAGEWQRVAKTKVFKVSV